MELLNFEFCPQLSWQGQIKLFHPCYKGYWCRPSYPVPGNSMAVLSSQLLFHPGKKKKTKTWWLLFLPLPTLMSVTSKTTTYKSAYVTCSKASRKQQDGWTFPLEVKTLKIYTKALGFNAQPCLLTLAQANTKPWKAVLMAGVSGPKSPHGKPRLGSQFSAPAWLCPGHCRHLGDKSANGSKYSFPTQHCHLFH